MWNEAKLKAYSVLKVAQSQHKVTSGTFNWSKQLTKEWERDPVLMEAGMLLQSTKLGISKRIKKPKHPKDV